MRRRNTVVKSRLYVFTGTAVLLLVLNLFFGPAVGGSDANPSELPALLAAGNQTADSFLDSSQRIRFTENRGQIVDTDGNLCPNILYTADAGGVRLYFTSQGVSYVFTRVDDEDQQISEATGVSLDDNPFDERDIPRTVTTYRMDMKLVGSNPDVRIQAERELYGYDNFYYAHCPDGITHVKSFGKIIYENVYDNIDMVWTASTDKTKYEFIVHPGGRVDDIRMRYDGSEAITTSNNGIEILSPLGGIHEGGLVSWQEGRGRIPTSFTVRDNEIGFDVESYDPARSFVIDPWATYYGGTRSDQGLYIDCDVNGNFLVSGDTESSNFPVQNAQQSTKGKGKDAVLVKFNSAGSRLWATFYGGYGWEQGRHVASDGSGNIAMTGYTGSTNFPVYNAHQSSLAGSFDPFLVKFNASGIRQWATFYGGSTGSDEGEAVAIDNNGNIYFSGWTSCDNFPLLNAYQNTLGSNGHADAFVVKLNSAGTPQWATFLGGSSDDMAKGIAVDASGNVYITGYAGAGYPLLNPHQSTYGGSTDAMAACFNTNGVLQWSTYYGGSGTDKATKICASGTNILFTGQTESTDFPTQNALQASFGGQTDAFIVCLSGSGIRQWATYYGGSAVDQGRGIAADGNGNIFVGGNTTSSNFPVQNALQSALAGDVDWFIAKLSSSGTRLWATYYGGSGTEGEGRVATDPQGNVLLTGTTNSSNLLVRNALQGTLAGNRDIFIISLASDGNIPVELLSFSIASNAGVIRLSWRSASEMNNHGFEIQRTVDCEGPWQNIGFVEGSGTTNKAGEYSYVDKIDALTTDSPVLYYRLKQIDFDGTFEYSPVVSVELGSVPKSAALLEPYPNPARDHLFIPFTVPDEHPVTIRLYNVAGQELMSVSESAQFRSGSHSVMANTSGLPSGTYFIELMAGLKKMIRRVTITR